MGAPAKSSDETQLLFGGATVSNLCQIFDLSRKDVQERLTGKVPPINGENQVPRYRIRDAAPYLCDVVFDVEKVLKTMTPSKLPPALQDNFWKAQISRQKFEENKGDLWRTARVVQVLSDVFKTLRMQVMMFNDHLEQVSELTSVQRVELQAQGDKFLGGAHKALVEQFEAYVPPPDEHGREVREAEVIEAMQQNAAEDLDDDEIRERADGAYREYVKAEKYDDGFGDD